MEINYEKYARIFKAVSDPKRLRILSMLSCGEMCACKILEQFNITQPTLSHDMKLLSDAGLVIIRKEGKWCHYSVNQDTLAGIQELISGMAGNSPLKELCESCK